jgi:hypothetical protein
MSSPSHEHLLGYVLGALEPWEHEQLEGELARNPQLADQAALLAARLRPLEACRCVGPPPEGLASRACNYVFEKAPSQERVSPARQGLAAQMSAEYGEGEAHRWTLADLVVAAGIFIAAGLLFVPAIVHSRHQALMAGCQNNLRELGEAFARAAVAHPNRDYNALASASPAHRYSGSQLQRLVSDGFLERPNVVLCPASPAVKLRNTWTVPTAEEVANASAEELPELYRRAAGGLAFSLGYDPEVPAENVKLVSTDQIALASDAPAGELPDMISRHHDGRGQNVLFASGRVAYICGCGMKECGDSLFWNRQLRVEAGLDERDIVLATGGTRPLSRYVQTLLSDE